jgi:nucleoside-diphosphate-sugar epimerase
MAFYLVTGATGRLGRTLLPALLSIGSVRAVVRPESASSTPKGANRFAWDLAVGPIPKSAFKGITHVVHLAGLVGDHPYEELLLHNGTAVRNLLSNCPSSVKKVVIASSISVYGDYSGKTVDESFMPKGESPYGRSKLMGELAASEYCGVLPIVFLRFGMIYGPLFEEGYFGVLQRIRGGKMAMLGAGNNHLPLLHSSDAAKAILLALEKKTPRCRQYNIVGGERMTQKQLFSAAAAELGVSPPTRHLPLPFILAAASIRQFLFRLEVGKKPSFTPENIRQLTLDRIYSTERARRELGFVAKVKLARGLKEVVESFLAKGGKG